MEATEQNLQAMAHYLRQTVSPDPSVRKEAETFLASVESQQNFSLIVLQIAGSSTQPMEIRMSAAILFKNFVKRHWAQSEDTQDIISENDRASIKTVLVTLMLSVPSLLQKQLSEALTIIADHDFPHQWENLLQELVTKMATQDFQLINGVLQTAHSIFKRYRHQYQSDTLFMELKLALDHFALPLLQLLRTTDTLIGQHATDKSSLEVLFNSLLYITKIFYSLSFQDIPVYFEDHLNDFFTIFFKYLTFDNSLLHTISEEDPGPLELVRSSICQVIELYIQRYEEASPLIPTCVQTIWTLLTTTSLEAKCDELVSRAIHVLTSIANQTRHRQVFLSDATIISSIIERIILPNMQLRESDRELFEDNPMEYIRRDMEGSDAETRRRASLDLVHALNEMNETHVADVCLIHLSRLCARKDDFISKSTATFLFTSLAAKSTVAIHGATVIHARTNIMDYYIQHILPSLLAEANSVQSFILKADALRFIHTFRQHITVEALYHLFPTLIQHLGVQQLVVQTYAAILIDRLLSMKRDGVYVFHRQVIAPHLTQLTALLFNLMPDQPTTSAEASSEHDHAMKATLRIILTCRQDMDVTMRQHFLKKLSSLLLSISRNPGNPAFQHYLFESIGALITFADDKQYIGVLEAHLFPVFQTILQNNVVEFMPYLFQLLALLLEKNTTISPPYLMLFPLLMLPPLWSESSHIPGLVRLLKAYLTLNKSSHLLGQQPNHMNALLGIFQKLLANRHLDHEGFSLLYALLQFAYDEMIPFMKQVWMLILSRLQNSRTNKLVRCTAVALCLSCAQNTRQTQSVLEDIQPRLFMMLLQSVLNKEDVEKIPRKDERNIVMIGLIVLLTENEFMLIDPYVSVYPSLFSCLLALLSNQSTTVVDKEGEAEAESSGEELLFSEGYVTSHVQLVHAKQPGMTCLKQIQDVEGFFVKQLHALAKAHPGRFPLVIGKMKQEQPLLLKYLEMAGVSQLA